MACIGRREHAGHAFHFDEARPSLPLPQQFSLLNFFNPLRVAQDHPTTESTGEWHHPAATMLIYLTPPSVGGPTIVLNQTRNSEELAEVGWVVTPGKGMVAVFDGTLLHGALPALTRGATDGRAPGDPDSFARFRPYLAHFFPVFSRFLRVFTVSTRRFQRAQNRNPGPRNSVKGAQTPF